MNSRGVIALAFFQILESASNAGHQIVGASLIGAFEGYVIIRIIRDLQSPRRRHSLTVFLDALGKLLPEPPANLQFRAGKYF